MTGWSRRTDVIPTPESIVEVTTVVVPALWDIARRLEICWRVDSGENGDQPAPPSWDGLGEVGRDEFAREVLTIHAVMLDTLGHCHEAAMRAATTPPGGEQGGF